MPDAQVRRARLVDAAAFAAVQLRAWREAAAAFPLPEPPDIGVAERSWERAIIAPPSPRHTTWVATESTSDSEQVVGIAALSPAADPDLDPASWLELAVLAVDPDHRKAGHGSRLLNAVMEDAAQAGEAGAVAWLTTGDDGARQFLESAGWSPDGAHRELSNDDETDPPNGTTHNAGNDTAEDTAHVGANGVRTLRQLRVGTLLTPASST